MTRLCYTSERLGALCAHSTVLNPKHNSSHVIIVKKAPKKKKFEQRKSGVSAYKLKFFQNTLVFKVVLSDYSLLLLSNDIAVLDSNSRKLKMITE